MDIASDHVDIKIRTPVRGRGLVFWLRRSAAQLIERHAAYYQTVESFSVLYVEPAERSKGLAGDIPREASLAQPYSSDASTPSDLQTSIRMALETAAKRIAALGMRQADFCLDVEVGSSLSRTGVLRYSGASLPAEKDLTATAAAWAVQRWNITPGKYHINVARTGSVEGTTLLVTCVDRQLQKYLESLCVRNHLKFTLFRTALSGRILRTMRTKLAAHQFVAYLQHVAGSEHSEGIGDSENALGDKQTGRELGKIVELVEFVNGYPNAIVRSRLEQPGSAQAIEKLVNRFADSRKTGGIQPLQVDCWPHRESALPKNANGLPAT